VRTGSFPYCDCMGHATDSRLQRRACARLLLNQGRPSTLHLHFAMISRLLLFIMVLHTGSALASSCDQELRSGDGAVLTEWQDWGEVLQFAIVEEVQIGDYCVERWESIGFSVLGVAIIRVTHIADGVATEVFRRSIPYFALWFGTDDDAIETGDDISGTGSPNLFVAAITGGDCCLSMMILELGVGVTVVYDDLQYGALNDSVVTESFTIEDLDRDGSYEIIALDHGDFGSSCAWQHGVVLYFRTVFRFDATARQYVPDNSRYARAFDSDISRGLAIALYDGSYSLLPNSESRTMSRFDLESYMQWPRSDAAALCAVTPLVTALFTVGRRREAWLAFDTHYRGGDADAAEAKSRLQHALLTRSPWVSQPSLDALTGSWAGTINQTVRDPSTLEEEVGPDTMVVIEIHGDAPLGDRVGTITYGGAGRAGAVQCPLVREFDLRDYRVVRESCSGGKTLRLHFDHANRHLDVTSKDDHTGVRIAGSAARSRAATLDAPPLQPLSQQEILRMPCSDLRLARNEVFARHGWIFASADLADHFASHTWYRPRGSVLHRRELNELIIAQLSEQENAEALRILHVEGSRGC
jgi:hypothetical protein